MARVRAARPEDRRRGVDRLLAFSDAVVSIAATLLVLPLVDVASEVRDKPLGQVLADNAEKLFVFALSFAVIYRFWLVHHATYERVVDYTPALLRLNFLWLLSIAFLPFPTEVFGAEPKHTALSYLLYIGTMLVTTATSAAIQMIIARTPGIEPDGARGHAVLVPALVPTLSMAAALVVAIVFPRIGIWSLLLLFVGGWLDGWLTRRRGQSNPDAPGSTGPDPTGPDSTGGPS